MRHSTLSAIALALAALGCGPGGEKPDLIPAPEHIELRSGEFQIDSDTRLVVSDTADAELGRLSERVRTEIREATGLPVSTGDGGSALIRLTLDAGAAGAPPETGSPLARGESYTLTARPGQIEVRAATLAGLFYGTRTLLQLLPVSPEETAGWTIPALEIRDQPRFTYRGLHLDVGRHFFPPEFIKRYINLMSRFKLNVFHWHLTEDQGWRLEIDRYPRLTEIGAWRPETILERNFDPYVGDGTPHGGYYTKEEVRDIVAYAADHYVTVIPEIEMPGHSLAALAAYPDLACTEGPFEVATVWGVHEDIYCPHERTFEFLENVLEEVIELFPSPYIHIGGDEAPKRRWEESAVAQDLMRREGLRDELELQSWFIRRIERFLRERDRRLIGWDEILEGGLAPEATVMSWRGVRGGIEAARAGHDVIMTPTSHMYFDYYQARTPEDEPLAIGGYLPLERVYAFEPVPPELSPAQTRHILGVQGNVWTEYMKDPGQVEYMAYPRALALAEVAWSPPENRSWPDFLLRIAGPLRQLEQLGVRYRIPEPGGLTEDRLTLGEGFQVELYSPLPWSELRYTLDGSDPGPGSRLYTGPLDLPAREEGTTVAARLVLPGGRLGPVARSSMAAATLRTALDIDTQRLAPGLELRYSEAPFRSAAEVADATPDRLGRIGRVQLPGIERQERFGLHFRGYLRVPFDDVYQFEITSDDGSQVYIKEELVLDHDGPHTASEKRAAVALQKGYHRFRVLYFQAGGGRELDLRVKRGDGPFAPVPDDWYYVENVLDAGKALPLTDAP